jgi:hypothetical protein
VEIIVAEGRGEYQSIRKIPNSKHQNPNKGSACRFDIIS